MDKPENILLVLFLVLPVLGGLTSYLVNNKTAGGVLTGFAGLILLLSILVYQLVPFGYTFDWEWFTVGERGIALGLYYDQLAGIMLITVSIITLLVSMFSIEYMKHDASQNRYFGILGLFVFSMFGIVLSSTLLLTFICWELVGFSSYLLIGFWFQKEDPPKTSLKAFMMNRVGDAGFLLALFIAFAYFKTFNIQELIINPEGIIMPTAMLHLLGVGLFMAAMGKSAQFPLQTWLPDAMTGPTPVSALIHAATMVAAGVYLLVRIFPLLSTEVLYVISIVGGLTAFMGAFAAFAQNDIKKVLAFSTISQLGYMVLAIGIGVPLAGFFHLTTHAFFKAGLFLCAGSVIHYYHETNHDPTFDGQDIRNMGGIRKVLPFTFLAFSAFMLSLAGLPLMSGFLSKEMILNGIVYSETSTILVAILAFSSVFMTACYMGRLYFRVFFGNTEKAQKFDESLLIKVPLGTLSLLSVWFAFSLNPISPEGGWLFDQLSFVADWSGVDGHSLILPFASTGLALAGLIFAYAYIEKGMFDGFVSSIKKACYQLSNRNFYLDDIYKKAVIEAQLKLSVFVYWFDKQIVDGVVNATGYIQVVIAHIIGWVDQAVVDGFVNLVARMADFVGNRTRQVQGGNVQLYFAWAVFGLLLVFYFLI